MKPFFVLITAFLLSLSVAYFIQPVIDIAWCGTFALSTMLIFTAFGHFKFADGMALMVPGFMPYKAKVNIIHITGLMEIAFALLLLSPVTRSGTAIALLVFLIIIFPANIKAAFNNINMEKADFSGPGPKYLWFRTPFQFLLIFWIYYCCL